VNFNLAELKDNYVIRLFVYAYLSAIKFCRLFIDSVMYTVIAVKAKTII